jgi:hypothetical protein
MGKRYNVNLVNDMDKVERPEYIANDSPTTAGIGSKGSTTGSQSRSCDSSARSSK